MSEAPHKPLEPFGFMRGAGRRRDLVHPATPMSDVESSPIPSPRTYISVWYGAGLDIENVGSTFLRERDTSVLITYWSEPTISS